MSVEPDWLRAQRKEREKSKNFMEGTLAGSAVLPLVLGSAMMSPRNALGMSAAGIYFLFLCAGVAWLARRFTSRGEVLRYLAVTLVIACGFMSITMVALASSIGR